MAVLNNKAERLLIEGNVGAIEVQLDMPTGEAQPARAAAIVAHPHPLFGGTMDNKVAQTLAKTFSGLGLRPDRAFLISAAWDKARVSTMRAMAKPTIR